MSFPPPFCLQDGNGFAVTRARSNAIVTHEEEIDFPRAAGNDLFDQRRGGVDL